MGFRGEALASIAAVAQVELQTRRQEDEIGTKVSIAGSKVTRQEPVSCPVGSNFKVDNLFFNVPARLSRELLGIHQPAGHSRYEHIDRHSQQKVGDGHQPKVFMPQPDMYGRTL